MQVLAGLGPPLDVALESMQRRINMEAESVVS